jgi:hypothetical protein
MERDEWTIHDESPLESACPTLAIIELAFAWRQAPHRTFTWFGMDSAPYFPRLQRYLVRLAMAQSGEIIRLQVESSGLAEAIDLSFESARPTIH